MNASINSLIVLLLSTATLRSFSRRAGSVSITRRGGSFLVLLLMVSSIPHRLHTPH